MNKIKMNIPISSKKKIRNRVIHYVAIILLTALISLILPGDVFAMSFPGDNPKTPPPPPPGKNEPGEPKDNDDHWVGSLIHMFETADKKLYSGYSLLRHSERLGLTEKQIRQIEELMLDQQEKIIRLSTEIKIAELRFGRYFLRGDINRTEAVNKIRAISERKVNLAIDHLNYMLDLRQLLTPKQLNILKRLTAKEKERRAREWKERQEKRNKEKNEKKKGAVA